MKKLLLVFCFALLVAASPLRAEDTELSPTTEPSVTVTTLEEKMRAKEALITQKAAEMSVKLTQRAGEKAAMVTKKAELMQKKTEVKEKVEEMKGDKCEMLEGKVNEQVQKYDSLKQGHVLRYDNMRKRISELITRLKAKGYNTSQIEADLVELETKIQKVETDYAAMIETLKNSQQYPCGESQGKFATEVKTAKAQMLTLRQDHMNIKLFWEKTIRPHLQALKGTVKEITPTTVVSPGVTLSPTAEASVSASPIPTSTEVEPTVAN